MNERPASDPPDRRARRDWYVPAWIALFVVACLGPAIVGARTLLSVNLIGQFYPWVASSAASVPGHQVCTSDTVDYFMPGIRSMRTAWFQGEFGGWQDVVNGGGPLGGIPNLGLLSPLSLPYLVLPLWIAPVFVKLLELIVAIGGTFLFLRRFGVSRSASWLAGFAFATSGFMVMWSNWPQTRVAALIPALFWAIERLLSDRSPRNVALIAVIVASMLLGGFPAVTGWTIYVATAYLAVRVVVLFRHRRRAALGVVAAAASSLVLGLMLSAVQMLPFVLYFQDLDTAYRAESGSMGLPLSGLLTLVAPDAYGLCIAGSSPVLGTTNPVELVT